MKAVPFLVTAFVAIAAQATGAAPSRVVSTNLCADEYVYRLVPRDRIAALSWLAGDRNPVVSTIAGDVAGIPLIRPSAETVLDLKPDLVVFYDGTEPRLRAQLAETGIRALEIPWANSLSDIRKTTRQVGAALGESVKAEALVAQMDALLDRTRPATPPVPALVYEPNGYATSGAPTDEIMAAAGLSDAAPEMNLTRSGTIPVESVIAAAPQLLILNGAARVPESRAELVLHHPALRLLRGKSLIASLSLTPLLCPGPWSVSVVPQLAHLGALARAHRPRARTLRFPHSPIGARGQGEGAVERARRLNLPSMLKHG